MLRTMGFPAGIDALSLFNSDAGTTHARAWMQRRAMPLQHLILVIAVAVSCCIVIASGLSPLLVCCPSRERGHGDNAIPQQAAVRTHVQGPYRCGADRPGLSPGANAMARMALRASLRVLCAQVPAMLVDDVLSLGHSGRIEYLHSTKGRCCGRCGRVGQCRQKPCFGA